MLAVLAILLALSCFCGILVSAASATEAPTPVFDAGAGITYDTATGEWVKTYDGTAEIDVANVKIAVGGTTYDVTSAAFDSADAGTNKSITLTYEVGAEEKTLRVPARINPVEVTLVGDATASVVYDPAKPLYENVPVDYTGVTLDANAIAAGLEIDQVGAVSFNTAEVAGGKVTAYAQVTLKAAEGATVNVSNYKVALLPVTVDVEAITLSGITWSNNGAYSFIYGATVDDNGTKVPACLSITATAQTQDGTVVPLKVMVIVDGEAYTLAEAYALGYYGNVYAGNTEEDYTLEAWTPNAELYALNTDGEKLNAVVTIKQAVYNVSIADKTFLGEADMSDPTNIRPMLYQILVSGQDVPAEVLAKITYTYYDKDDNASKNGVTGPGIYTVVATMPALVEGGFENYRFNVSELTATLTVKRNYIVVGDKESNAQIVVVGANGLSDLIKVSYSTPAELDRKAVRGFKVYKGYSIAISGAAKNETFTLMIPVSSVLISTENCEALTVNDLYLYDGVGNMAPAKDKYTVKLSDDGAYYIVEGFSAESAVTFVIAPAYNAPFFATPVGIALIILLVLLVLLAMFLIGLKLRQIERSKKADEYAIDTEGDVPAYAPVEIEDKIDDVDACLDESIDALADDLAENATAEDEATEDVDATAAVEDALDETLAEAAAETLDEEEDLSAADEATEALAEDVAEGLEETVEPATEEADVSEDVEAAVADAMEENLNESADATDAIALVGDDDDDDDDAFGGFGAGLTYIDVAAQPDVYADMLEREARGEISIVYRYRRSYQSKLAQSQGSVQDYYNLIKNAFLSYKGVKCRISWNYEAINLGRTHLAKFNAKTRTLYLYMALDPADLADTKYGFTDMSEKKKYASVPVLMKIKGDRKFKHALELVTMLCEEKLGLAKKKVVEEVDYKLPYMTTDALVAEGLVKKLAAEIPMELLTGEADADVTAVEAEAPAVEETPVEEVAPVEEAAPAEETVAEDVAADAAVAEDDTTNA